MEKIQKYLKNKIIMFLIKLLGYLIYFLLKKFFFFRPNTKLLLERPFTTTTTLGKIKNN
jgi:sugar phosphate permease